jgi:DNA repair exonuclease SbcCD ATPase subunit
MIIEKIDIRSFGLIKNMTLEFAPTVNVIEGQNEAGKSTIAAFIKYMLYGFDSAETEGVLSERRKRINWDTDLAEGSMVVNVKGKRYLISRSTTPTTRQDGKTAYKEESSIIDLESGATAFGKRPAGMVFFDDAKCELFENTAFIGQIGDSAINEGSVKESIENILFSLSEQANNDRAMNKIGEKMESLAHRGGGGGFIQNLMLKQEKLEREMADANENNKQILAKETELFKIRQEKKDAEEKLDKLHELNASYSSAMVIGTFDRLHALEEERAQKTEEYNKYIDENTRAGYTPTDSYINEIVDARRGVNDAYHELTAAQDNYSAIQRSIGITNEIESMIELADEEGGEKNILERAAHYAKTVAKNVVLTTLGALGALGAVVYQIVADGVLADLALRLGVGAIGVGALVLAVISVIGIAKNNKNLAILADKCGISTYNDIKGKLDVISEARAKRDGLVRSTDDARTALEAARLRYEAAKQELTRVIVRWGEEPPTSSLNDFLDKLETRVRGFIAHKNHLLNAKNTIELTVSELRCSLSNKNEMDIRSQVPPLKRKALEQINHDEIITSIAAYKNKNIELDKMAYTIENEIIALKMNLNDPAELYAQVKAVESRIDELRQRHKAYFIAYKAIESAASHLRAGISPRLGEYATELMGIMTDKKYGEFDINDGLKVSYQNENGEKKTVDFLSGGTRDLAYIAVRMALIDMLFTEKPPICLDESFAHQDNLRARSMMKALAHLGDQGYQCFVFTCRAREAALASDLVKAPGIFKLSVVED